MSTQASRRLLSRLYKDLAELQDNPYPGVAVFTDDANFRKLCLVLTPPSGPWCGLALHFDVELPCDWPSLPPTVRSSVYGIKHPNLFGSYICCDLLKPVGSGGANYTGGYSPALTLRGLFLQFLTFFSSTVVEQDYGGSVRIGDYTTTRYLLEDQAKTHRFPCSIVQCPCNFAPYQELLGNFWKVEPSEEFVISMWKAGDAIAGAKASESVKRLPGQDQLVHKIEWLNPRWAYTSQAISTWTCRKCSYGTSVLPHHRTTEVRSTTTIDQTIPDILLPIPAKCELSNLNDDTLGDLASYLPSESVISLAIAYPRFHQVVTQLHVLLRRELNCFFLRTPLNESVLGIGISLDTGARTLSSDFDWLSMEAFDIFQVRTSIQKRSFSLFLPLAFSRPHFNRVQSEIRNRLGVIDTALWNAEAAISRKTKRPSNRRIGPPLKPHHAVDALYRMMNNIVVSLMKSCDDTMAPKGQYQTPTLLHASEKAVVSYCHLFHLLICLCDSTPAILKDATSKVRDFIAKPQTRLKNQTPDMGELIVLIMLVIVLPPMDTQSPFQWESICGKFLEEAITRNVRWVLAEAPELEVMETGANDYRLTRTFYHSKTSLRLIMFQVSFLRMFISTYSSNLSQLDNNYGFAEKELPERMVIEIKEIYAVDTWPKFFHRVQFTKGLKFTKATFSDMLRKTVQESAARKYHPRCRNLAQLKWQRTELEKAASPRA